MLRPGLLDAPAMFYAAQSENSMLAWLLRALGTLGLCAGVYLVLRPLSVLGDVIPLFGSVLSAGAGLIAAFAGLACGLLVIALAWLFYRPLLGASLLLSAGAALSGLIVLSRKSGARKGVGSASVSTTP